MTTRTILERRLHRAGVLIAAGLVLQLLTLRLHPLAFVVFLGVACPLVVAGMVLFLWTIVSHPTEPET